MKFLSSIIVIAAVMLSACSTETPTTSPGAPLMKKARNIDWDVAMSLTTIVGSTCGTGGYINYMDVGNTNELTHVGRVGGDGDVCVNWTSATTGVIRSIDTKVVAANGDELNVFYEGEFAIDFGPPVTVEHWGDYWFDGGTGRFSDAEGSGTYTAVHQTSDHSVMMNMIGTLEY